MPVLTAEQSGSILQQNQSQLTVRQTINSVSPILNHFITMFNVPVAAEAAKYGFGNVNESRNSVSKENSGHRL